ncbi:MAG: sugar transferase [Methylobacter sp.]|uniref:Sugar transferase n=1 Tax=Candidatus Methylobacter titanis TaxID=3053457 RepID=A0AA43TM73_9GAMM|nr:sugar transferase [Candidatus Methylobacter titanis]
MKINEYLLERGESPVPLNDSSHYRVTSGEIFYDSHFLKQLRLETLRAQRSKSTLSLILLTLDKEADVKSINMNEILGIIREKTRDTDMSGFVNHNAICVLLPDTDEAGAKAICAKLANENSPFSMTTSSYPDHIFESLTKNGYVRPDAFPFELWDSGGLIDASWFKPLLKRGLDVVGSIFGIFIFMPVMLITALAIKVTSPGPVIFSQIRLGKQGTPFTFYKFRSMHVNMDNQIHREYVQDFIKGNHAKVNQGDTEKPLYKIKSDPRITRVGKFIRKTSIDELPQFFNVLKGNMSLVGPRPPLAYEAEKYQAWHLRRILEMKPGITGLWQVEGRSKTEWNDSVRLDIRYIQNWSLLYDLKILLRTVKEVLKCRGAM